jgi:hypothetical protein
MPKLDLLLDIKNLICFWDFHERVGESRIASGPYNYALQEKGGVVPICDDGFFGPRCAAFGDGPWLGIDRADCPALNFRGPDARFTVIAWIKRRRVPEMEWSCQAVAGMWNEHAKRQYCLFLNLRIHESAEQVGGHVSKIGGPTEGFKYCMDAAIGATPIPFDLWQCVAISYDGQFVRSYLEGRLDSRGERNPYHYPGGIFDGGNDGANFTVGAVARPEKVEMIDGRPVEIGHVQANLFQGLIGGLAVFDRALSDTEMNLLAHLSPA